MPKLVTTGDGIRIEVDTTELDRLLQQMPERREDILDTVAAKIEASAKKNIVQHDLIDTGDLWGSIHWWTPQPGTRSIGDGVEYGIYHEMGTSRMIARPWLVPAFEREYETLLTGLKALFDE